MYRTTFFLTLFCLLFFRLAGQARDTMEECALPEDSISLADIPYYLFPVDSLQDSCKILTDSIERIGNKVHPQVLMPLAIAACKHCEERYGYDSWENANAISNLAIIKSASGKNKEALTDYSRVLAIYADQGWSKDTVEYAKVANMMGSTYLQIGNYQKGIQILEENHQRLKSIKADTSVTFSNNCTPLASAYSIIGAFEKAFFYYKLAEKYFQNKQDTLNLFYPSLLTNKGVSSLLYGDIKEAANNLSRALRIFQKIGLDKHPFGLQAKAHLAGVYGKLLLSNKGIDLLKADIESILKRNNRTLSDAVILANYATLLTHKSRFQEADSISLIVLKMVEKTLGRNSSLYQVTLTNLGHSYLIQDKPEKTLEIFATALTDTMPKNTNDLAPHGTLLLAYQRLGKKEKIRKLITQMLPFLEGKIHAASPNVLNFLSHSIANLNLPADTLLLRQCAGLFFPSFNQFIRHNFPVLTEKEKLQFLERQYSNIHSAGLGGMFNGPLKDEPQTARYFYDFTLSNKGILFEDIIQLGDAIAEAASPEVQQLYKQWKGNQQVLTKQNGLAPTQRQFPPEYLDSLRKETDDMEIGLAQQSNPFRKTLEDITWEGIHQQLEGDEAAIEFFHFRPATTNFQFSDSTVYCALVLRKSYDAPRLVKLFTGPDLERTLKTKASSELNQFDYIYQKGYKMYHHIWSYLEPHLVNAKRIYFSPSGLLHQVAFSGILCPDHRFLSDHYDLRQVGSTRDIIDLKEREATESGLNQSGTILIVGGIPYSATRDCMEGDQFLTSPIDFDPNLRRSGSGKLVNLQSSYSITQFLDSLFHNEGWQTKTLTGCSASESNLKTALSQNTPPQILHLDTHGLVEPQKPDTSFIQLFSEYPDNLLNYSSLAFAGFNNRFDETKGKSLAGDGEIFASEFRHFNLTGTELVTLSSCTSSIGPVLAEEGMFGLQRAFRLAGARHVLGTLYNVNDDATAVFIRFFYKNIADGANVYQALQQTQQQMKHDQRYKHPYYWAGFVLL